MNITITECNCRSGRRLIGIISQQYKCTVASVFIKFYFSKINVESLKLIKFNTSRFFFCDDATVVIIENLFIYHRKSKMVFGAIKIVKQMDRLRLNVNIDTNTTRCFAV